MQPQQTILIIGATGLLGKVMSKGFMKDGYKVKALVRNMKEAIRSLPPG